MLIMIIIVVNKEKQDLSDCGHGCTSKPQSEREWEIVKVPGPCLGAEIGVKYEG